MQQIIDIILSPENAANEQKIKTAAAIFLKISFTEINYIRILRKSTDARKRDIKINLRLLIFLNEIPNDCRTVHYEYKNVSNKSEVIIIGAGPAGLFAALRLIELDIKPIIFERGKKVNERKSDINILYKNHYINPDSNYCFGEGGAGAFSDGKLFTRSTKRGNVTRILEILYAHGAQENILYETHPHIGTNKLPAIISKIRETIENAGGEFHFETRISKLVIDRNKIKGVVAQSGEHYYSPVVILATGHSAHDVFEFLHQQNIALESKPFAMGVRVEHPQCLIDSIQYHGKIRGDFLPAASYSLAEQVSGRGVFSFCMCPGGFIVPAITKVETIVVNGMSPSERNNAFANSGIVTEIKADDVKEFQKFGSLAGLRFQQKFEKLAYKNGGGGLIAPSQRIGDFLSGKVSSALIPSSYHPGLQTTDFNEWLPKFMSKAFLQAFKLFDNKMKGFVTNDALMIGVESRTSSPVRIPRNRDTYEHIQITNLYPCGEGAGYAGGIVSSAIDGENCAEKAAGKIKAND